LENIEDYERLVSFDVISILLKYRLSWQNTSQWRD